jgi:Transcriptional regulator PadR-like family
MQRLENRSGGIWRPSPGSVYPTLQMLEDERLVRPETRDGTSWASARLAHGGEWAVELLVLAPKRRRPADGARGGPGCQVYGALLRRLSAGEHADKPLWRAKRGMGQA